jgi:hypothetical protein
MDLSALFAACIEAIGLRPVIVVVRDHSFAGFWLTKHDFGSSVADDAPGLRTRLALHDLLLFETALVCGKGKAGFKRACDVGAAHVTSDMAAERNGVALEGNPTAMDRRGTSLGGTSCTCQA